MTSYTLEISEETGGEGISADVYEWDEMIVETTRVDYAAHGLARAPEDDAPDPRRRSVAADVRSLSVQYVRDDDGFVFRLVGDGDVIATERVEDDEWDLRTAS